MVGSSSDVNQSQLLSTIQIQPRRLLSTALLLKEIMQFIYMAVQIQFQKKTFQSVFNIFVAKIIMDMNKSIMIISQNMYIVTKLLHDDHRSPRLNDKYGL